MSEAIAWGPLIVCCLSGICFVATLLIARSIMINDSYSDFRSPLLVFNFFMLLVVLFEFLACLSYFIAPQNINICTNIYFVSVYWLLTSFAYLCLCLNGKPNYKSGLCLYLIVIIMTYIHIYFDVVLGFRFNGFAPVRIKGDYYWAAELFFVLLAFLSSTILVANLFSKLPGVKSRAILFILGVGPSMITLSLVALFMRFEDSYTIAGLDMVLFLWMNFFLLFASSRIVVDLSLNREHMKSYGLILKAASMKDATLIERMTLVEAAWYLLADSTTDGNIDEIASKLGVPVIEAEQKLGRIKNGKYLNEELAKLRNREFKR